MLASSGILYSFLPLSMVLHTCVFAFWFHFWFCTYLLPPYTLVLLPSSFFFPMPACPTYKLFGSLHTPCPHTAFSLCFLCLPCMPPYCSILYIISTTIYTFTHYYSISPFSPSFPFSLTTTTFYLFTPFHTRFCVAFTHTVLFPSFLFLWTGLGWGMVSPLALPLPALPSPLPFACPCPPSPLQHT